MEHYDTHEYDVVIIGAGGAGLRAAIESSSKGATTALVCKSLLGKAHTVMAEGGVAAALGNVDAADDWQTHFVDTMKAGKFLNDWRMVETFTKEAPDRVFELERWGATFDRTKDGKISQRPFGGHKHRRLCHVGDRTGLELIRTLQDQGIHRGIDVFMETTITRLTKDDGRISGAFGYARESGRFVLFRAKAVIVATGGLGKIYKITSNSWECTGDGFALAYEAGAELKDMEFVQFHPTGMVWPPGVRGLLVTEAVRGDGGVLTNANGERFMFNYIPESYRDDYASTPEEGVRWLSGDASAKRPPDLLSRDIVSKGIYQEVQAGRGTPHGGAWLDITHLDAESVKRKLPSMYEQFHKLADLDITKEPMEVGPTTHYMMGGVQVDAQTQTTNIPGLYAAGEVACGLHGATRLGGNSLSDLLVFGKRAGEYAAEYALALNETPAVDDAQIAAESKLLLAPLEQEGGENPFVLQDKLQQLMQDKVGIWRTEKDLEAGLTGIAELKEQAKIVGVSGARTYNPGWHVARDLSHMLGVAETIATAAKARQESRGAHTRDDYPDALDDTWGKVNLIVHLEGNTARSRQEPLAEMPPELAQLFEQETPPNV